MPVIVVVGGGSRSTDMTRVRPEGNKTGTLNADVQLREDVAALIGADDILAAGTSRLEPDRSAERRAGHGDRVDRCEVRSASERGRIADLAGDLVHAGRHVLKSD